jgi:hypothetical protein
LSFPARLETYQREPPEVSNRKDDGE